MRRAVSHMFNQFRVINIRITYRIKRLADPDE